MKRSNASVQSAKKCRAHKQALCLPTALDIREKLCYNQNIKIKAIPNHLQGFTP